MEFDGSRADAAKLARVRDALDAAEAVVVGAGAGLSASAGFVYEGARFEDTFADFEAKYGFHDMYTGGFFPYATPEERWAYWSRYILINRYMDAPKPVYADLLALLHGKDYFVLTTNVDHCFQKAGFDKRRLFYTQGDYGLFQCSVPCHDGTYDNEEAVRRMVAAQRDMRIPSDLVPVCPVCGKPMTTNLRADGKFVEDAGWRDASARYADFVRLHGRGRVLYLELGVGFNTPGIIKYPFWQMTASNPDATYACFNLGQAYGPEQIARQAVYLDGDIAGALARLRGREGA